MELIAKGAEANLYLEEGRLVKERITKGYRDKDLDGRLRRLRTQREAKLLENAKRVGINVPRVFRVDLRESMIIMEYIEGRSLKDLIDDMADNEVENVAQKVGETVSELHDANIVHNDLTTSNMILSAGALYFIDFGLGATSTRIEDKAMDLVVLKKSLSVAHTEKFQHLWEGIIGPYQKTMQAKEIMDRVKVIEKRVRYSE